jgi:uncharacterized protein YecE (DUF72 family)
MIRVGPAGWTYKDWEGIVYPSPKPRGFDQLAYMASYFNTIEINSTFYRPATAKTASKWVERVRHNADFRFTAKLWQRFTHERKSAWARAEVKDARAAFDVLQKNDALGAVLLQFPWSFKRTDENREWLEDVTRTFSMYPLVIEVRHTSWLDPEYFAALAEKGIGFVNVDQPLFHDSIKPSSHVTSHVGYIRVHGRNYREWFRSTSTVEKRYDYLYTAAELKPWAERAREIANEPDTKDVYVVTNNHYKGKAAANAVMLGSLISGKPEDAPPGVVDEYSDTIRRFARKIDKAIQATQANPRKQAGRKAAKQLL